LSRLIHGSVTDKVMRTARSSMLIFHPEAPVVVEAVPESRRETVLQPAY
jgi:hypothetical protein